MVQTSHIDFEWPQSRNAETTMDIFALIGMILWSTYQWRLTDCNVLFGSLCRVPKVRDNPRRSMLLEFSVCVCVWKRVQHSHIERRMHLDEHYISRTSTSSITYHVEPLHIAYIHVGRCGPYQAFGSSSFRSIRRSFLRVTTAIRY